MINRKTARVFTGILTGLVLSACTHTTQMTSGRDYLSKYTDSTYKMDAVAANGATSIDAQVRAIAAVEPNLHFPARIGLARIQYGQLTTLPAEEMETWRGLTEKLGAPYGEFVPVSPFIAAMVRPEAPANNRHNSTNFVVSDIRRASARQHLDYVLVYEVSQNTSKKTNALALADLTVLGLFVLPSRSVHINASASAMLIDVRNGYPYGTATAFATNKSLKTVAGSGASQRKSENKNYLKAVDNLTGEIEKMMKELWVLQHES